MDRRKRLKTALLYGEGSNEGTVFNFLLKTQKFIYLESEWHIDVDHAHGCSGMDILKACIKTIAGQKPDIVLCFIDTDDLKHDYRNNYSQKKQELEMLALRHGIEIVWQEENLEQVLSRASGGKIRTTANLKGKLERHKTGFMKSSMVKNIFNHFYSRIPQK